MKPLTRRKKRKPPPPLIPNDDFGRLLTIPMVREILRCSRQKIYNLHEAGSLEMVKFGGQTRVTDESLRKLMTSLPPVERKRAKV